MSRWYLKPTNEVLPYDYDVVDTYARLPGVLTRWDGDDRLPVIGARSKAEARRIAREIVLDAQRYCRAARSRAPRFSLAYCEWRYLVAAARRARRRRDIIQLWLDRYMSRHEKGCGWCDPRDSDGGEEEDGYLA